MRSLLAGISLIASAVFGGGCSEEASTGLSQADIEAITRVVSADGKLAVFGVQRTSETEVTAWAMPRVQPGGTTQPAGGATEFVLSQSSDGWRIVRQKPAEE